MTDETPKPIRHYLTADGAETLADNEERMIWYGPCCFWTDDWAKLGQVVVKSGDGERQAADMPVCPVCRCPGFWCTAKEWFDGAEAYQEKIDRYVEFINDIKERCFQGVAAKNFKGLYESWIKDKGKEETKDEQ